MIPLPLFQFGIDAYKIQYYTNNIHGEESIASGLIVISLNNDCPSSLTSQLHGTIVHKDDVPSRLSTEAQIGYYAASIIGSVVALPDYLGLGDSPGLHPYIHAETKGEACNKSIFESNSIIDVITPNPSSNIITLTSINYDVIFIFSLNGRLLLKEKAEPGKNTIEVTSLSSGIYFVRTRSYSQKLIIK